MLMAESDVLSSAQCVPRAINVAGVPVVPFESYDQALACIESRVEAREKTFWVAINPQKCFRAWHESRLLELLNQADVGICDGVGVSLASRILHGQGIKRCTGCDLLLKVLPYAAQKGWGVFMLGASTESNAAACAKLEQMYPDLKIVGRQDGYFQDDDQVVEHINSSGADLLFVGMGSPAQEYWISEHRDRINAPFCMGVGGSFDVLSGRIKRAPAIFRKTGTEWLFQLVTEPHKRFKRQTVYVPFVLRVVSKKLVGSSGTNQWTAKRVRKRVFGDLFRGGCQF